MIWGIAISGISQTHTKTSSYSEAVDTQSRAQVRRYYSDALRWVGCASNDSLLDMRVIDKWFEQLDVEVGQRKVSSTMT